MPLSSVLAPMLCLFMVTAVVWCLLVVRRIMFIRANPELLAQKQEAALLEAPTRVQAAGRNLINLFELPLIFYGLSLTVAMLGTADEWFMRGAWAFVGLRALHSVVHCTYNKLFHRFLAYILSSLILWVLVGYTAWRAGLI